MSETVRAAVVQCCAGREVEKNLARVETLAGEAIAAGADLVVLPENYCYIGTFAEKVRFAEKLDPERPGPILSSALGLARRGAAILVGGMPVASDDPARCYNTALLIDAEGRIVAHYHKIHLFDIDIPGSVVLKESEHVEPGREVVAAPFAGTVLGLSVCYDLRFPELYRQLVAQGCEIMTVPAAFTMQTGKDHWLPLLRARAIENQVFVLAANQFGQHTAQRISYGRSAIIDPWGTVIAQVSDKEGVALAELDLEYLRSIRRQMPCREHARL